MNLLEFAFMQRALITALLTGLMAPAIGTYIVQRRLSLLGDGLGHVAIAGVGLAVMTNTAPLPVAIVVCVAGAVAVELLRQFGKATGDVGLAILFYGGLAAGVLMAGVAGQGAAALSQYLFGSLTTVTTTDVWWVAILSAVVLVTALGLAPQLFAVSTDEEYAKVLGLKTRAYNLLIVVLAAITVTVSMRTVGLLLVSALMVVPAAAAGNLVHGFTAGLLTAMGLGVLTAVGGTVGSFYFDTAPGALIVMLAIAVFALSWPVATLKTRHRRASDDLGDRMEEPISNGSTSNGGMS
ncbi:MAG: metal ABC transporter permease [Propionibacteriaceae bacterium]|nr:metal ABC transporter permease [Propionibacteriaceae bacterium]